MSEGNNSGGQRGGFINRVLAGRYETLETLGEGPLLAAYRARDRVQNRIVTLKTLLPAYADRADIRELLRVGLGQTLSLAHPNITRTFDVGQDDETGTLFLAEEFVRGIDLKERIRRAAPFQLTAATETALAIAEALEFAHARGLAHGDVRPQNVRVSPEGQIKLTSFGFAAAQSKAIAEDDSQRRRVAEYIAPESTAGAEPTPSADLYALGVILFEMLTGETPYAGETPVQIALKHAQEPIPAPKNINAAIPTALDGITRKALGKTPETRYASASELLRDLRTVRDALRFGKSLSWSPLEGSEPAPSRPWLSPAAPAVAASIVSPSPPVSAIIPPRTTPPPPVPSTSVPEPPPAPLSSASLATGGEVPEIAYRGRRREEKNEYVTPVNSGNSGRSGGSRALAAIVWTAALGFVCALCFLTYIILQFMKPTNDVVVPNLVGKKLTEAQEIAEQNKFHIAIVDQQYRDVEPEGVVYQTGTTPGRHIKEGRDVQVWVSKGPRLVEIPDLGGMDFEKARKKLENVGLRLGDYKGEFDFGSAKGTVIKQHPDSGESVARGTRIDLTISKGEEPTPTPEPIPTPDTSYTPEPATTPDAPAPDASDEKVRTFDITYPPNGPLTAQGAPHRIRIDVLDEKGARTVFDEVKNAGEQVKYRAEAVGKRISVKLYDNDELRAEVNK